MSSSSDLFSRRIGTGGQNQPLEVVTHGTVRFEVDANEPALTFAATAARATVSPLAATKANGEG